MNETNRTRRLFLAAVLLLCLGLAGGWRLLPARQEPAPVAPAVDEKRLVRHPDVDTSGLPGERDLRHENNPVATPTRPSAPVSPTALADEPPPLAPFRLCSPLVDLSLAELPAIVSAGYHPPPMGWDDRHQGVDFSFFRRGERLSILGLDVQSALPGRVAAAIADSFPFGNLVIVETPADSLPITLTEVLHLPEGDSLYLLYAHMQAAPLVVLDQPVDACQPLGTVGKSGNAGVAHLHLETRYGPSGLRLTGMACYTPFATAEDRDNYHLWRTSGQYQHFNPLDLLCMQPSR